MSTIELFVEEVNREGFELVAQVDRGSMTHTCRVRFSNVLDTRELRDTASSSLEQLAAFIDGWAIEEKGGEGG